MRESTHPEGKRAALPVVAAPTGRDPESRVGTLLDELSRLDEEIGFLESERATLEARREAALRPLFDRIAEVRRELVRIVDRAVETAPRRWAFRRDAQDLLAHLAADLEERFGVRVHLSEERGWSGEEDPDEDDPDGDDFRWAHPEPDRPAPPPRRPKGPDPQRTAQGIYRTLARELHPDKARSEADRERRTPLMQELVAAWRARDLGALLRLLDAHGSEKARAEALDPASWNACLGELEEELGRRRARLRDLRHRGLPEGCADWSLLARDPRLFERALRREKAGPRQELSQIEHWRSLWGLPGGLERFLREVPPEEWPELV